MQSHKYCVRVGYRHGTWISDRSLAQPLALLVTGQSIVRYMSLLRV